VVNHDKNSPDDPEFIKNTKRYVLMMRNTIKKIANAKPKDRLDYVVATTYLLEVLKGSISGWALWVKSIENIESLNLNDWKEIHPEMVKLVNEWLKLDISVTVKKIGEATAKYKANKKKQKKHKLKKEKTTYVA